MALPGVVPPKLEFNDMAEYPAETASKYAAKYASNVHPVSTTNALLPVSKFPHPLGLASRGAWRDLWEAFWNPRG
jgi:hypothetical protein